MHNKNLRAASIIVLSLAIFYAEFILFSIFTEPSFENLRNIKLHYDMSWHFWIHSRYYPPFWDYFWHLFTLVFGPRFVYTSVANSLLIVLGAVFVYLLLKREGVNCELCALGFAFTLLAPSALFAAIRVRVESMMWVLLIGFLYFLIKSRVFTLVKNSVFAAIFASLGLLGKWSFLGYSLLPALIESLIPTKKPLKKLYGLLAFGLTGVILCGYWYFFVMSLDRVLPSATNDPNLPVYSFLGMLKLNAKTFFAIEALGLLASGLCSTLVLIGLIIRRSKTLLLLLSSIVGAIIFFSIPSHSEDRYFWPLIPVTASATMLGLSIVAQKFRRQFVPPVISTLLFGTMLINSAISWALLLFQYDYDLDVIVMNRTYNVPRNTYERFHSFLLKALDYTKKPNPLVAFFPALHSLHLDWSYPQYLGLFSPQLVPYEFSHYDLTEYWFFQEELRALKYDVILMNCKEFGDCKSAFAEFLSTDLNRLRKPYYQPGMTESEIRIFDPKSIIDDFNFILANYKPVDKYEALRGQVFVMWVRK